MRDLVSLAELLSFSREKINESAALFPDCGNRIVSLQMQDLIFEQE